MHPALHVDEIIREVVQYVDLDDLLPLALVCSVFYEPTMDRRWERCDLANVVRCLPGEVLETIKVDDSDITTISRVPSPEQWTRFRHHACRVKELRIIGLSKSSPCILEYSLVHDTCYDMLRQHYPEPCIFPRLRSIINLLGDFNLWADMLIRSSLKELHYLARDDGVFYNLLPAAAPALEVLVLSDPWCRDLADETILHSALRSLSHLRVVRISPFLCRMDTLYYLSTLPHLAELHLALPYTFAAPTSIGHENNFPSLRSLRLVVLDTSRDASPAVSWLGNTRLTSLRSLEVVGQQISARAAKSLLSALATYSALECVDLGFYPLDEDNHHLLCEECFLPLLRNLHHIRFFRVVGIPIDWTGSFFREIAPAWPNLTHLKLAGTFQFRTPSKVYLTDLLPFAQFCPALHALELVVSSNIPDEIEIAQCCAVSNVNLLSLGEEVVFEPRCTQRIATFLDKFFPLARFPPSRQHYTALSSAAYACMLNIDGKRNKT